MARFRPTSKDLMSKGFSDYNSMSERELRAYVQTASDIVHKRVQRIEKSVGTTPALNKLRKMGGEVISAAGKDRNELLNEITRARMFLGYTTSSVSAYKQYVREVNRRLAFSGVADKQFSKQMEIVLGGLTDDEKTSMWDIYHEVVGNALINPFVESMREKPMPHMITSDQLQAYVATNYVKGNIDAHDIIETLSEMEQESYRRKETFTELLVDDATNIFFENEE